MSNNLPPADNQQETYIFPPISMDSLTDYLIDQKREEAHRQWRAEVGANVEWNDKAPARSERAGLQQSISAMIEVEQDGRVKEIAKLLFHVIDGGEEKMCVYTQVSNLKKLKEGLLGSQSGSSETTRHATEE